MKEATDSWLVSMAFLKINVNTENQKQFLIQILGFFSPGIGHIFIRLNYTYKMHITIPQYQFHGGIGHQHVLEQKEFHLHFLINMSMFSDQYVNDIPNP